MKKLAYLSLIILFQAGDLFACEMQPKHAVCAAGYTKSSVVAQFSTENRTKWKWNQASSRKDRPEYSWSAEAGTCENGNFVSHNIVISATLNRKEKALPKTGSLDSLLRAATKEARYMPTQPINDNDKRSKMFFSELSIVKAVVMDASTLSLVTLDANSILEIKHVNKSTHLKLRALLPNKSESYECVAKIEILE